MITFNEKNATFRISTENSDYAIKIENGFLGHAYYGKKIGDDDLTYLTRHKEFGFSDTMPEREAHSFYDFFPMEMPFDGLGDFRLSALAVKTENGNNAIMPKYKGHRIYDGYPVLEGLPHVFGKSRSEAENTMGEASVKAENAEDGAENTRAEAASKSGKSGKAETTESDCQTLEITCTDETIKADVILFYTVFSDTDAIVRSMKIVNKSEAPVFVTKALSASFDMDFNNYDCITLHGSWARERHIDRRPIHMGLQSALSVRGETSHQEHPFIAVLEKNADWNSGNVYGVNFIYSGNFEANIQRNQFEQIRVQIGVNHDNFCWKLNPGEAFQTPEAVLVFSGEGLNKMSRNFHTLYRKHLIRSKYNHEMRPILINNWEATYFDFDTEKLLDIAREAAKDGIEMLVMDDGWFGKRNFDNCSLGDWIVNEEKIKGGLKPLVDEVNKLGLKFGIWFEPEMISPDSDLFRAHPDWAIQIPNRTPGMSRQQLVLDITRDEVRNYVYNEVKAVLESANIEYVKWDMNRQLSDIGSVTLPPDQMGEFFHRYVLALYKMQEQLISDFPTLLLENCSGGGARFDPGMFYYSPQIWCSDDTDAIERLSIQEGTALVYPLSTMGAHVSVCPNHAVGRVTPFKTRGYIALSGTFGYELDITKLAPEERSQIPGQIALYKRFNPLIREGDYYRIASFSENGEYDAWMSVSADKKNALLTFVQVFNHPNFKTRMVKAAGLDENTVYEITYPDEDQSKYAPQVLSGKTIMNAGIPVRREWGDFQAKLIYFEEKK